MKGEDEMLMKQISVFLENKKGRLAQLTKTLEQNDIDISAISIADTTNFGILRMIVNNPELAVETIRDAGFTVNTTDVLAVEVPDHPGGLYQVLETLNRHDISVEYLYSFVRRPSESALILFKVECPIETVSILEETGVKVLAPNEFYQL